MQIKSVAVLGAGAVGSYVIWGLSSRKDIRLAVIAEGPRAERLKQQGITINGTTYHPQVWTPQEANGVDLLVVALKYGALPGALDSIAAAVGPNTTVMSLMNGVDSEEIIAAKIGAEHVLPSLIKVASHKEADGYHFNPETTIGIIYGELAAPLKSERVQAVEALLAGTGIHSRVTPYIKEEIWSKFRLNVCNNLPQAILGAGVGCYQSSAHMKAISDGLCHELEAIAVAKGIDLSKVDASSRHGSLVPPATRYSTLQDLDAGRHTEIDMFSGALMRMGQELGIPTPYNENQFNYTPPQQDCTPCAPSANYNGLSIAGFCVSCAAIFFNRTLFGLAGIAGLILSIIGLRQCNARGDKGRGLAIAGIVIGAVLTLLVILLIVIAIIAMDYVSDFFRSFYEYF